MSISFCFIACKEETRYTPNKYFNKKPIQILKNITLYRSNKGEVYAKLNSKTVEYYAGDSARTVFPKGIKVLFYNKDLTDKSLLTANYAVNYTANKNIVYLRDSIRIINYNTKDTIYCRDLYWNQDEKLVYSNNHIRRYSESGQDYGDGLRANETFDSVTIINPHGQETFSDEENDSIQ